MRHSPLSLERGDRLIDPTEPAAAIDEVRCIECDQAWTDPRERWRVYLAPERQSTVCLVYCPDCAEREFS
jgi:hypothetical protein